MPEFLKAENLTRLNGVQHGFFTRLGGTSDGIYASLNCGFGSDDAPAHVSENRSRVARALSSTAHDVVTLYQEHGTTALEVSARADRANLPRADAVVSTTPGLVIGVLTADCAPILLADGQSGIVAAAHAGWRGALFGIIDSVIAKMQSLGAERSRIAAAVGPCINQAAYEVGPEFEAQFLERDPESQRFFKPNEATGRPHFDLPGYALERLARAGITNAIGVSPCTCENESKFFSYRRKTLRKEADYGRQISAIVVA